MEKSEMKTIAIIQARMGSKRLPGKVLEQIEKKPMLYHIVDRVKRVSQIEDIVIATSNEKTDEPIVDFCLSNSIKYFAGSENNVLDRFYQAANKYNADPIIRITGDCPLVDSQVVMNLIKLFFSLKSDHAGVATGAGTINNKDRCFPDGLDAECFSFKSLKDAWENATSTIDKEHVTPFIWKNPKLFKLSTLFSDSDYSEHRWTVDNKEDLIFIRKIYKLLYQNNKYFGMDKVIDLLNSKKELSQINKMHLGREGYKEIWK